MADKEGTSQRKRYRPLKLLFLNGDLHKVLFISRPNDTIEMWNYPKELRVVATYSDVKKRMEKAFTMTEAARMLKRNRRTLERAITAGEIEEPQFTYGLTEIRANSGYMWSEKNIMEMHSLLLSRHWGKARLDGRNTPKNMPNARELRALIRHNTILYTKTDEGFVPTWEAEQF